MKRENTCADVAAGATCLCRTSPLLFVVLGLGVFGAAVAFESARPPLLAASLLIFAFGIYRSYLQRRSVSANIWLDRAGRAAFWIAAIAVLAFALTPYYAGDPARLISAKPTTPDAPRTSSAPHSIRAQSVIKIDGMSCISCEATINFALEKTPGVLSSDVSYKHRQAVVEYDPNLTTPEKLSAAINKLGYTAEISK